MFFDLAYNSEKMGDGVMDITPPKSDQGIQRLKEANRNSSVKQTDRVSPFPAIESSETHHETGTQRTIERRHHQRRQHQRRQEEAETPFDTRSNSERRLAGRRQDDRNIENDSGERGEAPPHIDEKI
jgi:hypothetical protein